jgi:hypothetical protein
LSPACRVLALLITATLLNLLANPTATSIRREASKEAAMVIATLRNGLRAAALTLSGFLVNLAANAASG